jgi:transposase
MTTLADRSGYQLFVGVDIAAATFTTSWTTGTSSYERAATFPQTPDGFAAFQQRVGMLAIPPTETLVVLEATGSYWVALAVTLHQAGFAVAVVNPAHVHNFARSLPRQAKTDALDAHLLAQFAAERRPTCWTPPPQVYHELRQRLLARDGFVAMRQHARNQRQALRQWPVVIEAVQKQLDQVISDLDAQLATLEGEIAQVLSDGAWSESASLLTSIRGIGKVTSAWLLVGTLNFQACSSADAAAAYVGLVPLAHESGTSVRGRAQIGHGGNARLRTALYMATLNAARFNPIIKAHYQRLRTAGKPPKVARCAAARKLLHLAYAVVTKKQPFDPEYCKPAAAAADRVSRAA